MRLAVLAVLAGCPKKAPPPPSRPPPAVDVALQVVAVDPDELPAGVPTTARLYGAGLEPDVNVSVGPVSATVRYASSNAVDLSIPPLSPGTYDVIAAQGAVRATLPGGVVVGASSASCPTQTVLFETDASGLSSTARDLLGAAMACLLASGARVSVEGHADERGTTEYNVALGQRRADAVADFLADGGVATGRLEVVSYGEERPADAGHGSEAWARNRRVTVGPLR